MTITGLKVFVRTRVNTSNTSILLLNASSGKCILRLNRTSCLCTTSSPGVILKKDDQLLLFVVRSAFEVKSMLCAIEAWSQR